MPNSQSTAVHKLDTLAKTHAAVGVGVELDLVPITEAPVPNTRVWVLTVGGVCIPASGWVPGAVAWAKRPKVPPHLARALVAIQTGHPAAAEHLEALSSSDQAVAVAALGQILERLQGEVLGKLRG